jgi:hypothetical protein
MKSWLLAALAAAFVLFLVQEFGSAVVPFVIVGAVTLGLYIGLRKLTDPLLDKVRDGVSRMAVASVLAFMAIMILAPGFAFADTINIGQAFSTSLQPYVDAAVSALIAALIGWALFALNKYLGIKTEDSNRDALIAFVQRQAHSLVADGVVKLNGIKIDVSSPALAAAANTALTAIPDAMNKFGLTPERVQAMIIDALPKVQSVAAAQAVALDVANPTTPSTAAPAAAKPAA